MSTFSLSQTGTEINSAIGKVHNADTTPTQGSTNMVTSDGVYTAVNNVGVDALPITTEAEGIANYDNDEKVPTNAAVKDYFDTYLPSKFALFSISNKTSNIINSSRRLYVDGTVVSESFASISNGRVILSAGTYEILLTGLWHEDDNDSADYWSVQLKNGSIDRILDYIKVDETERGSYMGQVVEIGNEAYQPLKATTIHSSASNFNIEVYAYENSSPVYLKYVDVKLLVRKLV